MIASFISLIKTGKREKKMFNYVINEEQYYAIKFEIFWNILIEMTLYFIFFKYK